MLAWCRLLPAISVCFRYLKWPKSMNSSRYPELWRESKNKKKQKKLNVALCSSFSLHSIGDERKLCVMVQRLYGLLMLCVFCCCFSLHRFPFAFYLVVLTALYILKSTVHKFVPSFVALHLFFVSPSLCVEKW